MDEIEKYVTIGFQFIGVMSMIATITPTPKDDNAIAKVRQVLNLLAMNFGQSENKNKPGQK